MNKVLKDLPDETAVIDGKVVIKPFVMSYGYGIVTFYGPMPSCVLHGAMNKVSKDGIWRCLTCHVGAQEIHSS